jgi:hypothetical protein
MVLWSGLKFTCEKSAKLADKPSKKRKRDGEPLSFIIVDRAFDLARQYTGSVVWASAICYCCKVLAGATGAFAGKTSAANLALEVATHLNLTVDVSLAVSIVSTGVGINEFFRHRRTRKRLTARITDLEKRIDPTRTSSGLTNDGMTQPGDL